MSTRSELRLSLACGDYDINRGLVDGLDRIGDRRIARLFQDAKAKEIRYFAATGHLPNYAHRCHSRRSG